MTALRSMSQAALSFWPRNIFNQAVVYVLAVFVITRAVVLIGMLAANRDTTANESFFDAWNRFNTYWYIDIIEHGYNSPNAERETVVFFPLFLILMKGVSFVTGNLVSAGMLINNLAFLLALILLYKLVALELGGQM